jgi:Ca2+-transporting ATPase
VAARKAGLPADKLDARFKRVAEVPFSSERKLMTTVHRDAEREERLIVFTKGAPDVLLGQCSRELVGAEPGPLPEARRRDILRTNDALAGEALRTLGVAFRSLPRHALDEGSADEGLERDLVFLGLIGMIDPPREEARDAVARARAAGIRPVMITGDHPTTATVIARELGILDGGQTMSGAEIEKLSNDELDRRVGDVSVYARVNPAHKMRIVTALQRGGAVVAMTGDGVNDAPALKKADIGVAMVLNARSDESSAFVGLSGNRWLWAALGLSLVLQVVVLGVPFLQEAFGTVALGVGDWARCLLVASSVLWLRELDKAATWLIARPSRVS